MNSVVQEEDYILEPLAYIMGPMVTFPASHSFSTSLVWDSILLLWSSDLNFVFEFYFLCVGFCSLYPKVVCSCWETIATIVSTLITGNYEITDKDLFPTSY